MEKRLNVSSGPHVRSRLTTGGVMYDVMTAAPTRWSRRARRTCFGSWS